MMTTTTSTGPNTHEMIVVHRVFRREFDLLPGLIDAVRAGDTPRARALAEHCGLVTTGLHAHHSAEDEVLWPRLRERASLHADLVHRMEDQHQRIGEHLEHVGQLLPLWTDTGGLAEREQLAQAFAAISRVLDQHLGEEEREILPLVVEHLTAIEWTELGARMQAAIPKAMMLTFLGMVLEDATPDEQRQLLSHLPLRARLAWRFVGRRRYARTLRRLRGSAA